LLETPHVLVGAAIASKIPNPIIAFPIILASHFVLDMVPHWNPHLNTELKKYGHITKKSKTIIAFDLALTFVFVTYLFLNFNFNQAFYMSIGGFLGILPDVIEGPHFFLGVKTKIIEKWIKLQKAIQNDAEPILGLSTQIITIIASIFVIFK